MPSSKTATLHDTPDGFVERAIAIVIRDRTIELSVQIGINEKTMRDQFSEWEVRGDFETEADVTKQYCQEIQTRILPKLCLQLNKVDLELNVASVEPFAEHHKTAVMKLVATVPDEVDSGTLTFADTSFAGMDGAVRYAIKGRGKTLVTQSDAAPIIIRADRVELSPLSEEERAGVCHLTAKFKMVSR
jgi:hypothetical protein